MTANVGSAAHFGLHPRKSGPFSFGWRSILFWCALAWSTFMVGLCTLALHSYQIGGMRTEHAYWSGVAYAVSTVMSLALAVQCARGSARTALGGLLVGGAWLLCDNIVYGHLVAESHAEFLQRLAYPQAGSGELLLWDDQRFLESLFLSVPVCGFGIFALLQYLTEVLPARIRHQGVREPAGWRLALLIVTVAILCSLWLTGESIPTLAHRGRPLIAVAMAILLIGGFWRPANFRFVLVLSGIGTLLDFGAHHWAVLASTRSFLSSFPESAPRIAELVEWRSGDVVERLPLPIIGGIAFALWEIARHRAGTGCEGKAGQAM